MKDLGWSRRFLLRVSFQTTQTSINTNPIPFLWFLKVPPELEHLLLFSLYSILLSVFAFTFHLTMTRTFDSIKPTNGTKTIKILYSYGGKIIPRRTDGELRYVGGHTRVLAVDRSITFAELMVKFGELSGTSVSLRCKLPSEDLDVLVSITSDEDLANVIEEYDRFSLSTHRDLKIRALLFPTKPVKEISPPLSPVSTGNRYASKSPSPALLRITTAYYSFGGRNFTPAVGYPVGVRKGAGEVHCYPCHGQRGPRHLYRVPHWSHCS